MRITYLYNSGFILEFPKTAIVVDYYAPGHSAAGLASAIHTALTQPGKKPYVFVTHSHADHFDPTVATWRSSIADLGFIVSGDVSLECIGGTTIINPGDVFNDGALAVRAFGSTDAGVSLLIETDGLSVFHAGDLNNWHWNEECSPGEAAAYEASYLSELRLLLEYTDTLDVAIFPIDPRLGRDYTRGAQQFLERMKVRFFVPMHFREEYAAANAFSKEATKYGTRFVELHNMCQAFDIPF